MYHFATYIIVTIFYVLKILNAFTVDNIINFNFFIEFGTELAI